MNGITETRAQFSHPLIAVPSHDELTEQLFVRDLKLWVGQSLEGVQRQIADKIVAGTDPRASNNPVGDLRDAMEEHESFAAWPAMKRESQRQLWAAVAGNVERQADALEALAAQPEPIGSVRTAPDFAVPEYIARAEHLGAAVHFS